MRKFYVIPQNWLDELANAASPGCSKNTEEEAVEAAKSLVQKGVGCGELTRAYAVVEVVGAASADIKITFKIVK